MDALLSLEAAQAKVLAAIGTPVAETVSIDAAVGRVTAAAAQALVDLPPFASSAMDGFAVPPPTPPVR